MSQRYALYFSPDPHSELGQFGAAVLQRTPFEPRQSDASSDFHDHKRWRALTTKAAHYGFHATLKAPFEMNERACEKTIIECAEKLSQRASAIPLVTLKPRHIASFAALTLESPIPALQQLALCCVDALEPYRSPLSPDDRNRRLLSPLTTRQIELMDQYGYPYVDDEFRFHMTLSSRLSEADEDYVDWLKKLYERSVKDTPYLDRLSVFKQVDRHTAFVELASFGLKN